jgi:predicted MFS family arabinose efflux permease
MVTGSTSFAIVRFRLGVAEAGFFPGIIFHFTYGFPSHHHARIVSGFLIGLPVAEAVGAPISTALLGPGWPVRAAPTVVQQQTGTGTTAPIGRRGAAPPAVAAAP